MSIHFSRYSRIYSKLARPDVAQFFPRHVFQREPNTPSMLVTHTGNLLVNHENVLESTLIHLTEPFDNTEIFIIGTTNQSDILANRTKKLIQEVSPDVVFVQTEESWWKGAQYLNHVKSQEEMDLAKKELSTFFHEKLALNGRRLAYNVRWAFFSAFSRFMLGVPLDFNPFLPGLEVKYALEEAVKVNSKVVFLGYEFDKKTRDRMHHDNRYTVFKSVYNYWKMERLLPYRVELEEFRNQINTYGMKKFLESSCDQYFVNWITQIIAKVFPDVKRIMIEKKEEDIFTQVMENRGKKMVLLVNQIHMEGLEHHWCHHFGQLPRNVRHVDIDPIGDMPLRDMLFSQMYHVIMRDVKTSRAKTTPASYSSLVNPYWREFNFQYEHRNM